jgi:hypothetical protein
MLTKPTNTISRKKADRFNSWNVSYCVTYFNTGDLKDGTNENNRAIIATFASWQDAVILATALTKETNAVAKRYGFSKSKNIFRAEEVVSE